MKAWNEDLINALDNVKCERELFEKIEIVAEGLGFDYCTYGLRMPLPASRPKTTILSNYPDAWLSRYQEMDYICKDPSVLHGQRSLSPVIWNDNLFAKAPSIWSEAQSCGLRVGWAQSSLDVSGVGGMLTLARSCEALSDAELRDKELKMRWLVQIVHFSMSHLLIPKFRARTQACLTEREREVLKWTADGKTSSEISEILLVSEHTVNFHVKNVIVKLQVSNKTAAVVQAIMFGLLN